MTFSMQIHIALWPKRINVCVFGAEQGNYIKCDKTVLQHGLNLKLEKTVDNKK